MKGFDILHLKSAIQSRNHFDLSFPHLTTMAIGQIQPALHRALVPGDEFRVNGKLFSRCAPLEVPTYGRLDLKSASFFVPYHQVAEDADAWFSGKTSYEGITPVLRHFTMSSLLDFFFEGYDVIAGTDGNGDYVHPVSNIVGIVPPGDSKNRDDDPDPPFDPDSVHWDFTFIGVDGARLYCELTPYGRWCYKFLSSLGYQIPFNGSFYLDENQKSDGSWQAGAGTKKLNALPLLCALKAYNDWMSNSAKFDISPLTYYLLCVRQNKTILVNGGSESGLYDPSTGEISMGLINQFLSYVRLVYENDYFTSGWMLPNEVAESIGYRRITEVEFQSSWPSSSYEDDNVFSGNYGSVLRAGLGSQMNAVSQRGLDFLRAFDNWVKRNNYAGSRDVQQIYARMGVKPDYFKTHYAEVLGTSSTTMNVGDVTATANGSVGDSEAVLGDYAGKGLISSDINFSAKVSDYGELITLAWVSVRAEYPFGFDREVLRSEPLDFFTPEFDGLSGDSISMNEVFVNPKIDDSTRDGTDTFGFTERYNDYRCSRGMITGDYRLYDTMSAWHFGRDMTDLLATGEMAAQTDSVMYYERTGSQFNRIFNITDGSVDPFYVTMWFDIDAVRPMKNFNEVPNLGTGDTAVPKNGNVIN